MAPTKIETTANELVAEGKGILAADESTTTIGKRFDKIKLTSNEENRRDYREMLFSTPDLAKCISGVILFDETIRQSAANGTPFPQMLSKLGIIPGIKVDTGPKPLPGFPNESITEGLDGLPERLKVFSELGARFTKWRAVIKIGDGMPGCLCIKTNARLLAMYAAMCQEKQLVPIVEPEVLMDGKHDLKRCEEVTEQVLSTVFAELREHRVLLEGMLLKPNMVIAASECSEKASVQEVAAATVRCLKRTVPAAVPGIVFLSGGQSSVLATEHLNAINKLGPLPWKVSYSYGRALQDQPLQTWAGAAANVDKAQRLLTQRAKCNTAASLGNYSAAMESV